MILRTRSYPFFMGTTCWLAIVIARGAKDHNDIRTALFLAGRELGAFTFKPAHPRKR